jgi:hypothetical protein
MQNQQHYFGVIVAGTLWADDLELLLDGEHIAEALPMPARPGLHSDH